MDVAARSSISKASRGVAELLQASLVFKLWNSIVLNCVVDWRGWTWQELKLDRMELASVESLIRLERTRSSCWQQEEVEMGRCYRTLADQGSTLVLQWNSVVRLLTEAAEFRREYEAGSRG